MLRMTATVDDSKDRDMLQINAIVHDVRESAHHRAAHILINLGVHFRRWHEADKHVFHTFKEFVTKSLALQIVPFFGPTEVVLGLRTNYQ